MHIECSGPAVKGEPTILFEAGGGGDHLSWVDVVNVMESNHRVCAYDRAGLGDSGPPAEASRTTADQVADLRALLDGAHVVGPFVFGSHSYGATVATMFTQAYPNDVVGLLFVDPQPPRTSAKWRQNLPPVGVDEPAGLRDLRHDLDVFETDPSLNPEHLHLRPSFAAAAKALDAAGPLFGDRPVVVLSAASTPGSQLRLPADLARKIDDIWVAGQQELADESTRGTREAVAGTGHEIQVDQPSAVIDALEKILDEVGSP
jgi:pimeloyl-ACP methyl ester carboxylesterase